MRLADLGAQVACGSHRRPGAARLVVEAIERQGGSALLLNGDLTVPATAAAWIARIARVWGRPPHLVVTATMRRSDRADTAVDRRDIVDPVLLPPIRLLDAMVQTRMSSGAMVMLGSTAALRPVPGNRAYVAAQAALLGLLPMLAHQAAPRIRINGVLAGIVATARHQGSRLWQRRARATALRRMVDPDDIVDAVVHLLLARSTTGCVLPVDGGLTLPVLA